MSYPDDFSVPTFAAGKSIAVSRMMGIGIMSGFLLIIFLCGILIWTIRSAHIEPYILAPGGTNDQWQIVKPGNEHPEIEMTSAQAMQESMVWQFVQNWFLVSDNDAQNLKNWDSSCQRTDCISLGETHPCKIYCATGDDLFRRFKEDVLPTYKGNTEHGEYWIPVTNSIRISPVGTVSDAGGTWRIQMLVSTSIGTTIDVMAYAKVAKNIKSYPRTMGYYVADFNAYRVNQ